MIDKEIDLYQREKVKVEDLKKKASFKLLNALCNIQTNLDIRANSSQTQGPEQEILTLATNALIGLSEADPSYVAALARRTRFEEKVRLLPGQHSGITTIFSSSEGYTLRINVYGGLRAPVEQDMRDRDTNLEKIHSARTDRVLSQPTQIGWQIQDPSGELLFDTWIVYQLNQSFRLDVLKYQGERIEINPTIDNSTSGFKNLNSSFIGAVDNLLRLVPSGH